MFPPYGRKQPAASRKPVKRKAKNIRPRALLATPPDSHGCSPGPPARLRCPDRRELHAPGPAARTSARASRRPGRCRCSGDPRGCRPRIRVRQPPVRHPRPLSSPRKPGPATSAGARVVRVVRPDPCGGAHIRRTLSAIRAPGPPLGHDHRVCLRRPGRAGALRSQGRSLHRPPAAPCLDRPTVTPTPWRSGARPSPPA